MNGQRVLGVFAKWPVPGGVKTRLGPPAFAARVASAFLRDTLDRLSRVQHADQRVLNFAPLASERDFASLTAGRYGLRPQGEGDLGQRLARFCAEVVARGARSVVVVGTDSPTLPVEYVEEAFDKLEPGPNTLVLGPAADGGYYLFGCAGGVPPVFTGIDWSTARVLHQTVARLQDPAWKLVLLPPWYDVDTPDDWELLKGHVAALRRAGIDPGIPDTESLLWEARP